jgi:hypothetical protein
MLYATASNLEKCLSVSEPPPLRMGSGGNPLPRGEEVKSGHGTASLPSPKGRERQCGWQCRLAPSVGVPRCSVDGSLEGVRERKRASFANRDQIRESIPIYFGHDLD